MIVNKPGAIYQNEHILISPQPNKQAGRPKRDRSAQQETEAGLFLLRPEKSETPNLGNDYMNTPGSDSNDSPRKRSRISSVATPAL